MVGVVLLEGCPPWALALLGSIPRPRYVRPVWHLGVCQPESQGHRKESMSWESSEGLGRVPRHVDGGPGPASGSNGCGA